MQTSRAEFGQPAPDGLLRNPPRGGFLPSSLAPTLGLGRVRPLDALTLMKPSQHLDLSRCVIVIGVGCMKRKVNVEWLVRWAVREELPKGRPVSTPPAHLLHQARTRDLAAALSPGRRAQVDQFGFVPGAPHEDALRVKDALAALPHHAHFDDRQEVAGLLGHLAAIASLDAVLAMRFNPRGLVLSHAAMGTRPSWEFSQPTPRSVQVPFYDARGARRERPLVRGVDAAGNVVDLVPNDNRGRKAMTQGVYDLAMWPRSVLAWGEPSPVEIAEHRAQYLAYFDALEMVRGALSLAEFDVVAAPLARRPWISGQVAPSRVLDDGKRFVKPLALAPKRKAAGPPLLSKIEQKMRESRVVRHVKPGVESEIVAPG